jgi:hypothetical protein
MIKGRLEKKGVFAGPPPEGYTSLRGLAKKLNISDIVVKKAVADIDDLLGDRELYIFGPRAFEGFSPLQQTQVEEALRNAGKLFPPAPEGYLAKESLFRQLAISPKTFSNLVADLEDELGEVERYRFGPVYVPAYSPRQQAIIKSKLGHEVSS